MPTAPTSDGAWAPPSVTHVTASYTKVTGLLIGAYRSLTTVTGDLVAHEAAYKAAQFHSALFGWWGLTGLFWTPISLNRNNITISSVRTVLATGKPAADWLSDPSGRFDERYWDGTRWTGQVRSVAIDGDVLSLQPPIPFSLADGEVANFQCSSCRTFIRLSPAEMVSAAPTPCPACGSDV